MFLFQKIWGLSFFENKLQLDRKKAKLENKLTLFWNKLNSNL